MFTGSDGVNAIFDGNTAVLIESPVPLDGIRLFVPLEIVLLTLRETETEKSDKDLFAYNLVEEPTHKFSPDSDMLDGK